MKEDKKSFKVPPTGSLGLLALGHKGLDAWREAREVYRNKQKADKPNEKKEKNG